MRKKNSVFLYGVGNFTSKNLTLIVMLFVKIILLLQVKILAIFLILSLGILNEAYGINFEQEGLEITQITSYKIQDEPYEQHLILGEVKNTLEIPLEISGSSLDLQTHCKYLYPSYSRILEKETMFEDTCDIFVAGDHFARSYLPPGETLPFSFSAFDSIENIEIQKLEFNVKRAEPKPGLLETCCIEVEKISGPYGGVEISGKIINKGDQYTSVETVRVFAYDKNGNILETGMTFIDGSFLNSPGIDPDTEKEKRNSAEFKVVLESNPQIVEKFHSYKIFAESDEYTTIPEFSELAFITLGSSLALMFVILRKFKFLNNDSE